MQYIYSFNKIYLTYIIKENLRRELRFLRKIYYNFIKKKKKLYFLKIYKIIEFLTIKFFKSLIIELLFIL